MTNPISFAADDRVKISNDARAIGPASAVGAIPPNFVSTAGTVTGKTLPGEYYCIEANLDGVGALWFNPGALERL